MSIEGVTAELLVRYLDSWVPGALRSGRRATFVRAWPDRLDVAAAEATVRVFAEFADRMHGRELTAVYVAPTVGDAGDRLEAVRTETGLPPSVTLHVLAGSPASHVPAALAAARAAGAPLLACIESGELPPLRPLAAGKPADVLLLSPPGTAAPRAAALHEAGFDLVTAVDFVNAGERLACFGTGRATALETFKDELWQLDEYAGVRLRDPYDPDAHLLDISLNPHPGPLRRYVLAHLAGRGPRTVTEIRHAALADTVYRSGDVIHVLQALVTAHAVVRDPAPGRLAGDTVLSLPR